MTLTRRAIASWRLEGISPPRGQSPTATRCLICSMICRYMGRPSDWEITRSLLCILGILSIHSARRVSSARPVLDRQTGDPAELPLVVRHEDQPPCHGLSGDDRVEWSDRGAGAFE